MRSLEKLVTQLKVSDEPGLEAFDERFGAIGDHAQARRFGQAADIFEELVDAEIYDARLSVFYFYHCIDTQQAQGALGVIRVLNAMLSENLEAWGTVTNREKVLVKSLTWLWQNVTDLVNYHLESTDSKWKLFESRDEELLDALREEFLKLNNQLTAPVWGTCGGLIAIFQKTLETEFSFLDEPVAQVQAEEDAEGSVTQAEVIESPVTPELNQTSESAVTLKASPQFFQLQNKLAAFEILVQKGQFEKAAVVSNDLMELIKNFDPRQYFPELFAGFFGELNKSIQQVRPHLENRDPLTWDTLEQFYQVDLDGFVQD
ncbi:MAG: hypothetical protein HOD39_14455 [Verrucomicrobia bacterium]|nr:hypothetical protein [Verrucomicrobiota bacterium]